jgi:hypothetical protein
MALSAKAHRIVDFAILPGSGDASLRRGESRSASHHSFIIKPKVEINH